MAASAENHAFVEELFRSFGPVSVRRMFGGAGLYADELMFGILHQGVVYLKADDAFAAEFERQGAAPFSYERSGRVTALSYWRLPERLYDDPDELADWARRALACANAAKARVPRRYRKRDGGS